MKIKCIFFDIDNTLFNSKELALRARKNAIKAMIDAGLPAKDMNSAYSKLKKIIKKFGSNYGKHFDELLKDYKITNSKIVAAGVVAYHDTKFAYLKPFPNVEKTLLELKTDYNLGVITNGKAVKQWDKLIRLGLEHFFDTVVISDEVGFEKPASKIFEEALKKANCKAKEAVMIGDHEFDMAAKKIGMKTICFGITKELDSDYKVKNFKEILGVVKKIDRKTN